jgi:hypothetical protein
VGDYLKPLRDQFRREKFTVHRLFRERAGIIAPGAADEDGE